MPKKPTRSNKNTVPKKPENLQIVIRYKSAGKSLTDNEWNKLIRKIKKERYYYDYLSGKFKFVTENKTNYTEVTYIWKGGAGDQGEATSRVIDLLTGDFDVLPEGVTANLVNINEV